MDELIGRRVAKVGVNRTAAQRAVGRTIELLVKDGSARPAWTFSQNDSNTGGVICAGSRMFAGEEAGEHAVGDSAGAIPVLGQ
jgi:hypothetical protein